MKRREFLAAAAGAVTWPLVARAQPAGLPVIGILGSTTAQGWTMQVAAFRKGLSDAGYTEGRNLAIEAHWADGQYDRLPGLAAELVQKRVSVIVAFTTPAVRAATTATTTIPIVFTTITDPVQAGFVASLNRPGGNVTGVTMLSVEIVPKLLEVLRETIPKATTVGFLYNPTNPTAGPLSRGMEAAARSVGQQLHVVTAGSERDFDDAFARLRELKVDGLIIARDAHFSTQVDKLAALAARHAIPAIYQGREFPVAGGLMSYSASEPESYRQTGLYAARILKGDKPAELPVVQTSKVEFVVNLKTAKTLGLTMPLPLLGRADEVIE